MMPATMPEMEELWRKALQSLEAAKVLLEKGYYDFAASRGYYAMFYAAGAALLSRGLSFSKHSAVIAAFGKQFVSSGLLPKHLHRSLLDAFDLRVMGDYGSPGIIGEEKARALLERAEEFMREVGGLLKREGYTLPVTDEEG